MRPPVVLDPPPLLHLATGVPSVLKRLYVLPVSHLLSLETDAVPLTAVRVSPPFPARARQLINKGAIHAGVAQSLGSAAVARPVSRAVTLWAPSSRAIALPSPSARART